MKRVFFILTVTLSMMTLSSAANGFDVAKPVLESFNSSFKNATEVAWTNIEGVYKVSFMMNEQYVSAFYDQEGNMMALTRSISSRNLPLTLQVALKKDYEAFWITDLHEISNEQGTFYLITV